MGAIHVIDHAAILVREAGVRLLRSAISAGRLVWEDALRSGTLLGSDTIPMDGEMLLYVTLEALDVAGHGRV